MSAFTDNDFCFACGSRNPLGLQLTFFRDGELLCTRFTPGAQFQGFYGVLHGGVQATVLDDLMANHLFRIERVWNATAEISVRYRRPVPLDRELLFCSRVTARRKRIWELQAWCQVVGGDGAQLTTAQARFLEVAQPEGAVAAPDGLCC